MEIFGLEKLSLVDFDGFVAATVFTGSCNFRCGFCHNSALVLDSKKLAVIPENEVLDYLKKRKGILEGLCITGGEPTLNPDLPDFIRKVKDIGYSVKVDTNGTNPEMVKLLAKEKLADYFAIDIKNDRENYAEIIGFKSFDTQNVEKTVEFLLSGAIGYEFRTTLIAEYHKAENIIKIAEWIKGADKYFMQKFKSGDNCISGGLSAVDGATAKEFLEIIRPSVKYAALRGYD
ncbi:MAG: anaerobic ribonucleoside-triphosphate reductase activating protein [Clostridia bacterium]|nr:anaerobic ribonucleoside-triphosphate reductase activating protein [Clostridia bacterium]